MGVTSIASCCLAPVCCLRPRRGSDNIHLPQEQMSGQVSSLWPGGYLRGMEPRQGFQGRLGLERDNSKAVSSPRRGEEQQGASKMGASKENSQSEATS